MTSIRRASIARSRVATATPLVQVAASATQSFVSRLLVALGQSRVASILKLPVTVCIVPIAQFRVAVLGVMAVLVHFRLSSAVQFPVFGVEAVVFVLVLQLVILVGR